MSRELTQQTRGRVDKLLVRVLRRLATCTVVYKPSGFCVMSLARIEPVGFRVFFGMHNPETLKFNHSGSVWLCGLTLKTATMQWQCQWSAHCLSSFTLNHTVGAAQLT